MKKMLIIGLSVFLAGALLFTIALSSQDWNIENISTRPAYTRNEYLFNADGVDSITVNDNNMDFNVGLSNDEQIHLYAMKIKKKAIKLQEDRTYLFKSRKATSGLTKFSL